MATIGSLIVDMTLDSAAFVKGVKRAELESRKLNLAMSKVERQVNSTARAWGRSIKQATSFRAAIAAVAGTAGIGLLVKRSIEAADAIGKTADKVGFTVEQLQELRFAAKLNGVEVRTLDMALQRFSRRIGEVAQGQGELLKTAEQYGIELRDQSTGAMRSNIDLFKDFAEVIRNAESEQERLRIAFKLFDSEGAALVNLMAKGADAIDLFRARARSLGLVMSESMVRGAERTNDKFTILGDVLRIKVTTAVVRNAEAIGRLADRMTNTLGPAIDTIVVSLDWMADHTKIVSGALGALLGIRVGSAFGFWGVVIGGVVGALGGLTIEAQLAGAALTKTADVVDRLNNATPETVKWIGQEADAFIALKEEALKAAEAKILAYEAGGLGSMAGIENPMRREAEILREEIARLRAARDKAAEMPARDVGYGPGRGVKWTGGAIFGKDLEDDKKIVSDVTKALDKMLSEGKRVFDETRTPLEKFNLRIADLNTLLEQGGITQETYARAVRMAQDDLEDATVTARDYANVIGGAAVSALDKWARGYGSLREVALGALGDILQKTLDLATAQNAAAGSGGFLGSLIGKGLDFLTGAFTGGGGYTGSSMGDLPGTAVGTFAAGGDHMGGLRIVGENGPELEATGPARIFNANQTKDILSGKGRGGDTYVTINAQGATEPFVDQIMSAFRSLGAKVDMVDASVESRAVGAVVDARLRGRPGMRDAFG